MKSPFCHGQNHPSLDLPRWPCDRTERLGYPKRDIPMELDRPTTFQCLHGWWDQCRRGNKKIPKISPRMEGQRFTQIFPIHKDFSQDSHKFFQRFFQRFIGLIRSVWFTMIYVEFWSFLDSSSPKSYPSCGKGLSQVTWMGWSGTVTVATGNPGFWWKSIVKHRGFPMDSRWMITLQSCEYLGWLLSEFSASSWKHCNTDSQRFKHLVL